MLRSDFDDLEEGLRDNVDGVVDWFDSLMLKLDADAEAEVS